MIELHCNPWPRGPARTRNRGRGQARDPIVFCFRLNSAECVYVVRVNKYVVRFRRIFEPCELAPVYGSVCLDQQLLIVVRDTYTYIQAAHTV